MKYKVISCAIFQPYIEYLTFDKEQYVFTFLEISQHNQPKKLAKAIQLEIDRSDENEFDKIIILYGVCGGALMALKAHSIPLIVIKVHDCMSILLGSKERFERLTENNKSIGWSCYALKKANYTNDSLLKWQSYYDEETIAYLKEMLSIDVSYYISLNIPLDDEYLDSEKQVLTGDLKFLEKIINLKSNEIVDVYPGQRIVLSIDDNVIKIV